MNIAIIVTTYNEHESIAQALSPLIPQAKNINAEILVVSSDDLTLKKAKEYSDSQNFKDIHFIKDNGVGKPAALNLAAKNTTASILFLTDGDMHVDNLSLSKMLLYFNNPEIAGVSGHPVSLDDKNTLFGYFSHLFCEAAHQRRISTKYTPMSGYLYAIRKIDGIFPLNERLRSEDAYISGFLKSKGYKLAYEPAAYAYVHFPKNMSDWIKQKTRSLGGNIQIKNITADLTQINRRSIFEDLSMALFPLKYASSPKEFIFSLILYPLRLYLWQIIYIKDKLNLYSQGRWEMIKSSKH